MEGELRRKRDRGVDRKCWRGFWDDEGRESFRQKVGRLETKGRELDEDWKIIDEMVKRAIEDIERERGGRERNKEGMVG